MLYQPNDLISVEARYEDETLWLTRMQMASLFGVTPQNITIHMRSVYKSGELIEAATSKESLLVQKEGGRQISRNVLFYNLDAVIAVGYRVNSLRATQFRIWATKIIKDYITRGVAVNPYCANAMQSQLQDHEKRLAALETSLPPPEQVLLDGEMLTAEVAIERIIKTAHKRLILIDGWCDAKTLLLLGRRVDNVKCTLYLPGAGGRDFSISLRDYNAEFPTKKISVKACANIHDRFLIVDKVVYHLGASLKDAGHRISAIMRMSLSASLILSTIKPQLLQNHRC